MDTTKSNVSASASNVDSSINAIQNKDKLREYELNRIWEASEREKWVGELRDFFSHNMHIMENAAVQSVIKNVDLDKISINKALEIYDAVESVQSSSSHNITPYYSKEVVNSIISASRDKPIEAQLEDRISIYHRHITAIYSNISIDVSSTNAEKKAYHLHTEASKHPEQFDDLAKIISKSEWDILYRKINGIGRFSESIAQESNEATNAKAETAGMVSESILHPPVPESSVQNEANATQTEANGAVKTSISTEAPSEEKVAPSSSVSINSEEDKESYRKLLRLPHFEDRPDEE